MKFYISQTIGDGSEGNEFRPSLSQHVSQWRATDMRHDATASGLLFVECPSITESEHQSILADGLTTYIPINDVSGQPIDIDSNLSITDLAALSALLESHEVPMDDITPSHTVRDVLRRIVKRFLIRQILTGVAIPSGLDHILSAEERTKVAGRANALGVTVNLTNKVRHIIKDVAQINHPVLRTHYDN